MPSPFPGMDPYLEDDLWSSVCFALACQITRQLVPLVRPRYVVLTEEHWVPSVDILATFFKRQPVAVSASAKNGSMGQPRLLDDVRYLCAEVRTQATRQMVTSIELLTPLTKDGLGRQLYVDRRRQNLRNGRNVVEIDLFQEGLRSGPSHSLADERYCVAVHRASGGVQALSVPLPKSLPKVSVPLLNGEEDVQLDLQAAFTEGYDMGGYDYMLDYSCAPEVRLSPQEREWTQALLAKRGFHWNAPVNGAGREH